VAGGFTISTHFPFPFASRGPTVDDATSSESSLSNF
jgi:hypothetical protein